MLNVPWLSPSPQCSRTTIRQQMSRPRPLPHPSKADLVPVEILSGIFLLIVQHWSWCRRDLMLVCRRWHAIILSTPGIHSQLTIRRATQKEVIQAFIQGRKSRLDVIVDMNDEKDGSDFIAEDFLACFMAAAQAAARWSSLNLISPPPHGEYHSLQILQPLGRLKTVKVACGLGGFFEQLMTAISRSVSPNLTTMILADPVAVRNLVQPAGLHITHSLTTLKIQLSKRMSSPVDILPHFQRLEVFEARNLCLSFYPPDASLPFLHTLQSLNLQSVSVQWMAGRVFPVLRSCYVIFPHHINIIQAPQPVSMPNCVHLLYHFNDLRALLHFHLPPLKSLDVKSGQWNVWRGNPQLAALCPMAAAGVRSLTHLTVDVECSEQLLVYMLNLVPALKVLQLGLARPNALSMTFFQAFLVREPTADGASDKVGPLSQSNGPICPSLFSLYLHYRRWLRGPDKKAFIVAFGTIMESRNSKENGSFNLTLSVDEANMSSWSIDKPLRKSQDLERADLTLGVSVPHGIISISTALPRNGVVGLPLKEAEYLRLRHIYPASSLEFIFTHDHMELMVYDYDRPPLSTSSPCALTFFSALRVLVVVYANPSFLAGHTFHKLERCRLEKLPNSFSDSPSSFTETEMPVCTRIDVDNPYLLATFKLPQIHELAIDCSDPKFSMIWEKRIAVNANLSGLTLLHMKEWSFDGDLTPILQSLPLLERLIIRSWRGVVSFRAFLPMDAHGTSGLKQTSGDGQTLALLCPRLHTLEVEGQDPSVEPELIPTLKEIVTLRAEYGSPLKHFTFSEFWLKPGTRYEVNGMNGSFTMEKLVLPEAEAFKLDI